MVLLEEEPQPNADAEGNQGMILETVDSGDVSMSRGNVVDVDKNSEETKEIRVSTKSDVHDDSRLPEFVTEQRNLQLTGYVSDMINEHLSQSDSSISMLDDSSASGISKVSSGNLPYYAGHHYDVGDMVWGKVKSHPWWPGHIYSDTFASPAVRRTKRPGHFLVAFYGDSSYGWFDPEDLIPFVPNFDEKSQQLNSRTFINAVEEAIDEISRRSGLGLSCRCRNPYNFRPTEFQGFLAVDVCDYEAGAIYPVKQIEKARDRFQPSEALEFIKMVARMSISVDSGKISVIQNKAIAISYRRATFEEFDETYAQAFGQKADRPPRSSLQAIAHTAKVLTTAPLSGPMVIQESLNKKKSPIKLSKPKEMNKDRYLFKRREDPNEPKTNQKKLITTSIMPTAYIEGSEEVASGDFILQKRTPQVGIEVKTDEKSSSTEAKPSSSFERESDLKPKADNYFPVKYTPGREEIGVVNAKANSQEPDSGRNGILSQTGHHKKVKAFKRPVDLNIAKSVQGKMKKKVKKMTDGKRSSLHEVKVERNLPSNDLKLSELLGSLQGLAMNPFHSFDIYSPKMVKNAIIQFRSQVFQKSLASAATVDIDPLVESSLSGHLPEKHRVINSVKQQPKPLTNRPGIDPSKVIKKREPSDRQEESTAKRVKKITNLKSMATDKKATINPLLVKADIITKTTTRIREPTALVMKFPPQVSLPSASELKARLARFGPLDQLGTRIFYKTYTCRVVFLYKNDAMAANNHLSGSSCLFGNVQLKCHVRDMSLPLLDSEPNKTQREETAAPTTITPPPTTIVRIPQQQQQQLKSCLKKPSTVDDGTTFGNGIGANRVMGRVKFVCGVGEETSPTIVADTGNSLSSIMSSSSSTTFSSSLHGFDNNNNNTTTTTSKSFNRVVSSLPPPTTHVSHLFLSQNAVGVGTATKMDIGSEMLTLLTKCSDVVAKLSNYLGYTPYHSL